MCSILSVSLLQQRQREVVGQRGAAGQQAAAARRQPVVHRHLAPRAEHPEPEPAAASRASDSVGGTSTIYRRGELHSPEEAAVPRAEALRRRHARQQPRRERQRGGGAAHVRVARLARRYAPPATPRASLPATRYPLPPATSRPRPSPRSPGRELLVGLGLHLLGGQFRVHGGVAEKPRPGTYFLKLLTFRVGASTVPLKHENFRFRCR